ncbi:MAG TPA: IclR family transcriptional regulator [Geobacteraceae bacterium]|nr:IclR family transcriptional regulator [Geobacteraceae bacterium]
MGTRENKSNYLIQTVCHALDLLDQFNCDREELGVTELSRRMALHKNNIFRLLATLESRNFVEQNHSTGNYRLGLKNLEMGQTFSRHLGLRAQARPVLEALTAALQETSSITVMNGNSIASFDAVETPLPVRVVTRLGVWLPLHCTAPGKVFLAGMHTHERKQKLPKELQQFTPRTITDQRLMLEHLELVAARGYALDDEELEQGVRCVSAPVYDSSMQVVGAISVTGPANRMGDERLQAEIIPVVLRSAEELSRRMGGHQP